MSGARTRTRARGVAARGLALLGLVAAAFAVLAGGAAVVAGAAEGVAGGIAPALADSAAAGLGRAAHLDALDLAIAGCLTLVAGVVSVLLELGLERRLALAAVRMVAQLLLLGYVLKWVFGLADPLIILPWLALMVFAASREAVARASRRYAGAHGRAFLALALSATVATFTATELVIGVRPWWQPQYVIPFFGMVLGNGLNSVSLTLDLLLEAVADRRALIELDLALGATRWEALREPIADAVRRGMVPIINAMSVAGLVSMPGLMTGQILAGQDPLEAVRYQIVMMFMIAAGSALAAVGVGVLSFRALTSPRHQLLWQRVRGQAGSRHARRGGRAGRGAGGAAGGGGGGGG